MLPQEPVEYRHVGDRPALDGGRTYPAAIEDPSYDSSSPAVAKRDIGAPGAAFLAPNADRPPHLGVAAEEAAARILSRLVGPVSRRRAAGEPVVRRRMLEDAQAFIARNLHRPALSPGLCARALGISVRQVHIVFRPTRTTFGRYVLGRRLELVAGLLRQAPRVTITEIAYASGFDSLSTFFRCYRGAFGCAPGASRALCRNAGG